MASARFSKAPIIFASLFALLLLLILLPHSPAPQYLPGLSSRPKPIPNIVHYVYLKKDEHSVLHFTFQDFLSVYASIIYFNPTSILIHTDHNESSIGHAATFGSKWTRKILADFPKVVSTNYAEAPTHANGNAISKIEHKSDFVRIEEVYRTGGVYLDWDVLPLRDVKYLRESGFQNVVGRQPGGKINNGAFMSQKGSALTYLMKRDGPVVFNGGWETHSVKLITAISDRLVRSSGEVLIMDEKAFSPTSWKTGSVDELYAPHNDTPVTQSPQVNDLEEDPLLRWDNKNRAKEWELDFSGTYLLHAFRDRGHKVDGFEAVTVPYVLARDSNYALAAWPIVRYALDQGVINESDVEP
ncbi:glycosyltransferase family 32 protein [Trematosphaeria pertusa]|uniref:Glycosyltransferase family 32 protein n=1 Tax=Trematosphaeria pertusa TaxID=390896 RepID=A0A6A6IMI0_9PLEO|nr:glycosyltransferase family 32 protein [Trematosphaeria pertusa]KAF2251775.1 glycosyltransferase family 32 protein [Trematosphaeria pertusa]